jgi:Na+/H+-translocating membrane pyrophosphatase
LGLRPSLGSLLAPLSLVFRLVGVPLKFRYDIVASKFFLIMFHHFQIAISASNTGGAWDNAKKYIEVNLHADFTGPSFPCMNLHYTFSKKLFLKEKCLFIYNFLVFGFAQAGASEHARTFGPKGSDPHKAAVIGYTIGDPLKDTSGPSLNILIKLMAVESLVFAPYFAAHGGITCVLCNSICIEKQYTQS